MKKLLLLHLASLIIMNISAQRLHENLKLIINKYSSDSLINGSVLIAKNDQILFQGSYGYKNFETKEINSLSTLFPVASLTKQFTLLQFYYYKIKISSLLMIRLETILNYLQQ
jgi:CubicO group peptidase (beta-lactamase class C family)